MISEVPMATRSPQKLCWTSEKLFLFVNIFKTRTSAFSAPSAMKYPGYFDGFAILMKTFSTLPSQSMV